MRDLQVRQDFEAVKEKLSSFLKNYASLELRHQVFWLARWLDRENWYTHKQMLAELRTLTAADVEQFYPSLLGQMHIEILVGGCICKEDALRLSSMVETALKPVPLPQAQWPMIAKSLAFPPASNFIYHQTLTHSQFVDQCIYYCLYTGPRFDCPARAKTLLLGQMASGPAFDQLRTQEQLGYIVLSGAIETATNMSYRILIQGTRAPMYLGGRIDAFLTKFADILGEMPESEFELHKSSLVRERLEKLKPKNLKEAASRVWSSISAGHFDFTLGMPSPGLY
jgi:insulysin